MTLDTANAIVRATDELTGAEIALLTLIKDLQTRVAELQMRLDSQRPGCAGQSSEDELERARR